MLETYGTKNPLQRVLDFVFNPIREDGYILISPERKQDKEQKPLFRYL